MARFLFAAWPYVGCVFPRLAVARALKARGHDVAFYTGMRAQEVVVAERCVHLPFSRALEEHGDRLLLAPDGISRAWRYPWRRLSFVREFFVGTIPEQMSDLERILGYWKPDAIIAEPCLWAPFLLIPEVYGIPVAMLEYSFCSLPGPGLPPAGLDVARPRHWHTRLFAALSGRVVDVAVSGLRRSAGEMRRRYGLPPLRGTVLDVMRTLPLFLIPSSQEYDYRRTDLPTSVHYIGPCQWYPGQETPDWLAQASDNQPVVHVTAGSYAQFPMLLHAAAQGLAHLPMRVVISSGMIPPQALNLGRPAENVVVTPWVSYALLFPHVDVVVSIGGGGTVIDALAAGIPLVIVPIWDHGADAYRVAEAGAGIILPERRCTPRGVREAVEHVLRNPSYRTNAQRIAASLRCQGGPVRGAELLETMVQRAG